MEKKYAILSMDIEDWYHLDYFTGKEVDKRISMLDGLDHYIDLLDQYGFKTTFFALSELIGPAKRQIEHLLASGHELACHGKHHARPLTIPLARFREELIAARNELSEVAGCDVIGYRAPCYSIDNARHDMLHEIGFRYSSSKIACKNHPLYGELDLSGYRQVHQGIYCRDGFCEFELSTQKFMGRQIPVSGGGWIRILPWHCFMKPLLKKYLKTAEIYVLYIHPFELSYSQMPRVNDLSAITRFRAHHGLGKVYPKLESLLSLLQENSFQVKTFRDVLLDFA